MMLALACLASFVAGALIVYLWRASRVAELSGKIALAEEGLKVERSMREKMLADFRLAASDAFREVKKEGDAEFAQKKDMIAMSVDEMKSRLKDCQSLVQESDRARMEMFGSINRSVEQMLTMGQAIRLEANSLKKALTSSTSAQGNLVESILEGILQRNGLRNGEDYHTQVVFEGQDGSLRPDIVLHLPDNKELIIDSKAPLQEYVLATQAEDIQREREHYLKLASQIRDHFNKLGKKEYQRLIDSDIRFVLMFVPDGPVQAALSVDPTLMQEAYEKNVLLTTPMTIIPLIKLITHSWKQYRLATDVRQLGLEVETLGSYLATYMEHFQDVRQGLKKASEGWNRSVSSWRSRMTPQLEKIKKLSGKLKDLPEPEELPQDLSELSYPKQKDLLQ